jgi:hypothetical protein
VDDQNKVRKKKNRSAPLASLPPVDYTKRAFAHDDGGIDELVALCLLHWIPFEEFIGGPESWTSLKITNALNRDNFVRAWRNSADFTGILNQEPRDFSYKVERWSAAYYYITFLSYGEANDPTSDFYGMPWSMQANSWFEQMMFFYTSLNTRVEIKLRPPLPQWLYPDGIVPETQALEYELSPQPVPSALDAIPFQVGRVQPPTSELDTNLVFEVRIGGSLDDVTEDMPQLSIASLRLLNQGTCPLAGSITTPSSALSRVLVRFNLQFRIRRRGGTQVITKSKSSLFEFTPANEPKPHEALLWREVSLAGRRSEFADLFAQQRDTFVVLKVKAECNQVKLLEEGEEEDEENLDFDKVLFSVLETEVELPPVFVPGTESYEAHIRAGHEDYRNFFLNSNAVVFYFVNGSPARATLDKLGSLTAKLNEEQASQAMLSPAERLAMRSIVQELSTSPQTKAFRPTEAQVLGNKVNRNKALLERLTRKAVKDSVIHLERVKERTKVKTRIRTGTTAGAPEEVIAEGGADEEVAAAPVAASTKEMEIQRDDWLVYVTAEDRQARTDTEEALHRIKKEEEKKPTVVDDAAAAAAAEEQEINWHTLWNGAVLNNVQRCAVLFSRKNGLDYRKVEGSATPLSSATVSGITMVDPDNLDASTIGYAGTNLPNDSEVLTVDVVLERSPVNDNVYTLSNERILPEEYTPEFVGGIPSGTGQDLARNPVRYFHTGVRQVGAATAITASLKGERIFGAKSEKDIERQRARLFGVELGLGAVNEQSTTLRLLSAGLSKKGEGGGDHVLKDENWLKQNREDEAQQIKEESDRKAYAKLTKEEREAQKRLREQLSAEDEETARLRAEVEHASAAVLYARQKQQSIGEMTLQAMVSISERTKTFIRSAWEGYTVAIDGKREVKNEQEREEAAADAVDLPHIFKSPLEWVVFVNRGWGHNNEVASPQARMERLVDMQNDDDKNVAMMTAQLDYVKKRSEVGGTGASASSGPRFGGGGASTSVTAKSATEALLAEWKRLSIICQRFGFLSIDIPVHTSEETFFANFADAFEPLLRHQYEREKASDPVIYKNTKLSAWGDEFNALTYARIKLAQYMSDGRVDEAVTDALADLSNTEVTAGVPLVSTASLRALSEMFLIRLVILYSPLDSSQVKDRGAAEYILSRRIFKEKDLPELYKIKLVQCAVIEPPAGTGFFKTCYVAGVVDVSGAVHFYYLKPIPTYSESKIDERAAAQIRKLRRDMKIAQAQRVYGVAPAGEESAVERAGGYIAERDPYVRQGFSMDETELSRWLVDNKLLTTIKIQITNPTLLFGDESRRYTVGENSRRVSDHIRISVDDNPLRLYQTGVRYIRMRVRVVRARNEENVRMVYLREEAGGKMRYLMHRVKKNQTFTSMEQHVFWFAVTHASEEASASGRALKLAHLEAPVLSLATPPMQGRFAWPWLVEQTVPESPVSSQAEAIARKLLEEKLKGLEVKKKDNREAEKKKAEREEKVRAIQAASERVAQQTVAAAATATPYVRTIYRTNKSSS